jgi:hypothetical protein
MYDEELSPENQGLAKDKLKQARSLTAEQKEKSAGWAQKQGKPTRSVEALGLKRTEKFTEEQLESINPHKNEGRMARALRQRQAAKRQAKAATMAKAGITGTGKGTMQKVRQIKSIIRFIRGGTLIGTSLGDIFFCLGGLFLSLVGEWAIAKFQVVPGYKMFDPEDPFVLLDKILWYGGWAVIAAALALAVVFAYLAYYLYTNPLEAIKFGIGL